jgi:hypothetical protein
MIDIHTRQPPAAAVPQPFKLANYAAAFDNRPVPYFSLQEALGPRVPQYSLDAGWQRGIRLVGYDLEQQLPAGQPATLALYWRIETALADTYKPVVTIVDRSGILVEEARPLCQFPGTTAWSPDYINPTAFTIQTTTTLPPGAYRAQVSLQHTVTGEILPLADETKHLSVTSFLVEDTGETP